MVQAGPHPGTRGPGPPLRERHWDAGAHLLGTRSVRHAGPQLGWRGACACACVCDSVHKCPDTHNVHICVHAASGRHAHEPHAMHLHTCVFVHTHVLCTRVHAIMQYNSLHMHVSCTHLCPHLCPHLCAHSYVAHMHACSPPHVHAHTHAQVPPSPSQAAGSECVCHPVAGTSSQVSGWVLPNPVCSSPPGWFGWLFSPLAPGCEPMCRCLPWPPGLGTCCSPGRQPFALSSCGSPPLPSHHKGSLPRGPPRPPRLD